MLWAEKHAPKRIEEIVGNGESVEEIRKWALDWKREKNGKPILLCGPPGVGKSALAYALANSMGWEIVEMNASDLRNKDSIERVAGAASSSSTLSGERRLVLIDEVDGLQRNDRGGAAAVLNIIRNARQPVILTANDYWEQSLLTIRTECKKVELRRINFHSVAKVLQRIAEKEGVELDREAAEAIAGEVKGDLRAAINDLQATASGRKKVRMGEMYAGRRDHEKNVFEAVRIVLKSTSYAEAVEADQGLEVDHDMFKRWIEENIPIEYEKPEDVARAFDALSKADIFDGRIMRRQYWGFLRYSSVLMTAGVALAKEERYKKFSKYGFPSIVRKLSASKKQRSMEKEIGLKVGERCHCSWRRARGYFPLLALLPKEDVQSYFSLSDEELAFITGEKKEEKKEKATARAKKKR